MAAGFATAQLTEIARPENGWKQWLWQDLSLAIHIPQTPSVLRGRVLYRDFHQAKAKDCREALLSSLESNNVDDEYTLFTPVLCHGLRVVLMIPC